MDDLCDMFSGISTKTGEEEYEHLENIIDRCERLTIKETLSFLREVYELLKRYKVSFMDNPEGMSMIDDVKQYGIRHGTELFIHNYETIDNPKDMEIFLMYCIAKSTLRMLKEARDSCGYESDCEYSDYEELCYDSCG